MPHAENAVTIEAPVATVFAFLADGTNNPKWRPGVLDITPPPGGPAVGATYKQGLKGPRGKRIDGDYQITALEPPAKLAFAVVAGPARPTGTFELSEAAPGQTSVHFSLDLTAKGVMKLMGGMIQKTMDAEVACLANLKSALEASG